MASVQKFEELSGLALENAIRLHKDSILLFKSGSYASANQLAITATEELGKAILLEEYVFQHYFNGWNEVSMRDFLVAIFGNHVRKQRFFAYFMNDLVGRYRLENVSSLMPKLINGHAEKAKQDSTYIGLTRDKKGKVNLNGRIISPMTFAVPEKSKKQITLNNDFLVVYIEGFIRGVYGTDSYSIAVQLNEATSEELQAIWTNKSIQAKRVLKKIKVNKKLDNPLSDWEDE